jgi:hypothetical protein
MITLSMGVRLRAAGLVIVPPREAPRDKVRAKVSLSEAITVNALKRENIRGGVKRGGKENGVCWHICD